MKIKTRLLTLFFTLLTTYTFAQGQKKQIFFVVDTLSTHINNRFVETGKEGQLSYYTFFCKCLTPHNRYLTFSYNDSTSKTPILNEKPNYKYSSLKGLLDTVTKSQNNFNEEFDLFITEALINNKYKTNKVKMVIFRRLEPDIHILKNIKFYIEKDELHLKP